MKAIYNLGLMKLDGDGIEKDVLEGKRLLMNAARLGHPKVAQFLSPQIVIAVTEMDPWECLMYERGDSPS
eukprot:6420415-Amphidinium_carterae.1